VKENEGDLVNRKFLAVFVWNGDWGGLKGCYEEESCGERSPLIQIGSLIF